MALVAERVPNGSRAPCLLETEDHLFDTSRHQRGWVTASMLLLVLVLSACAGAKSTPTATPVATAVATSELLA